MSRMYVLALVINVVVLIESNHASNHVPSAFKKVFGADTYSVHFSSENEFTNAQSSSNAPMDNKYLVCVDYSSAESVRRDIARKFGEANVHTAYVSAGSNTACFLVVADAPLADEDLRLRSQHISVASPLPWQMKIHPSTMYHFGLTTYTSSHRHLEHKYSFPKYSAVAESTLVVSTGLGVPSKGHKSFKAFKKAIRKAMRSEHPANHIARLFPHDGSSTVSSTSDNKYVPAAAWKAARDHLNMAADDTAPSPVTNAAQCDFDNLQFVDAEFAIHISNLASVHAQASHALFDKMDFTPRSVSARSCLVSLVAALTSFSEVIDIRLKGPLRLLNADAKSIMQSGVVNNNFPYHKANLTGVDQFVGVADSGVDLYSCYFANADGSTVQTSTYRNPKTDKTKRKVIQYVDYADDIDEVSGHGTHVCGSIVGVNINNGADVDNGHAPSAKIAFWDMGQGDALYYQPPLSTNVFEPAYGAGARVHSDSWGSVANMYDDSCVDIDQYHITRPYFLALFAAGNEGDRGYYSVINPAVAKNSMAIGASSSSSSSIDSVAYFSSLGPTFDGRIKPDVVAPGYSTTSAWASGTSSSTCALVNKMGTSMATPAVAGAALLVRQYFIDTAFWAATCDSSYASCGSFSPKGATVKAVLIHSGEPMTTYTRENGAEEPTATLPSPPDSYQGYGRVFLQNVLPFAGIEDVLDLFVEELTMTSLQRITYTVEVADISRPLKATIAWMDPANTIVSEKMLLHDIDLVVTRVSDNQMYYGNGQAGDEVNNVEQVSVISPVVGTYTVTVTAKVLSESATQAVSLVITSGGGVTGKATSVVLSSFTSNELNCPSGEQMLTIHLMDRGGNGWGSDNSYVISVASSGSTVRSGTMDGSVGKDSYLTESFCLSEGIKYKVKLDRSGSNSKDMTLDIPACSIHLSRYMDEAILDLTSSGKCNECPYFALDIMLLGPRVPIPYGWKDDSVYVLQNSSNATVAEGTLATGVMSRHTICLKTDEYHLEFNNVPSTDDYYSGGSSEGIDQYRIALVNCGVASKNDDDLYDVLFPEPMIRPGYAFTVTINGALCSYEYTLDKNGDENAAFTVQTSSAVVVLMGIVVSVLLTV